MPEVTFKLIKSKMKSGPNIGQDFYMFVGEYPKEVIHQGITRNLCVNVILPSWEQDGQVLQLMNKFLKSNQVKNQFYCQIEEPDLIPDSLYLGYGEDTFGKKFIYSRITQECRIRIFEKLVMELSSFHEQQKK